MKAIIRKDEDAVSPVIATILMVAITVVLAAVLYVMVAGLITPTGNAPKQIGATITSSGGNWIVTFTSVPSGLTAATTTITMTTSAGVTGNVTGLALSSFTTKTSGITYQPASTTQTALSAADSILLAQVWWPSGFRITLTSGGAIVYGPATLQ